MGIRPQAKFAPSAGLNSKRRARSRSACGSTDSASQPASLKLPPKPIHFCKLLVGSTVTAAVPPLMGVSVPTCQYPAALDVTSAGRSTMPAPAAPAEVLLWPPLAAPPLAAPLLAAPPLAAPLLAAPP